MAASFSHCANTAIWLGRMRFEEMRKLLSLRACLLWTWMQKFLGCKLHAYSCTFRHGSFLLQWLKLPKISIHFIILTVFPFVFVHPFLSLIGSLSCLFLQLEFKFLHGFFYLFVDHLPIRVFLNVLPAELKFIHCIGTKSKKINNLRVIVLTFIKFFQYFNAMLMLRKFY